MDTPEAEFDTIISKFNDALSQMGPGMGDPVTRGERALLKTFWLFIQQEGEDRLSSSSLPEIETQSGE